jgi:hypothetical protein
VRYPSFPGAVSIREYGFSVVYEFEMLSHNLIKHTHFSPFFGLIRLAADSHHHLLLLLFSVVAVRFRCHRRLAVPTNVDLQSHIVQGGGLYDPFGL